MNTKIVYTSREVYNLFHHYVCYKVSELVQYDSCRACKLCHIEVRVCTHITSGRRSKLHHSRCVDFITSKIAATVAVFQRSRTDSTHLSHIPLTDSFRSPIYSRLQELTELEVPVVTYDSFSVAILLSYNEIPSTDASPAYEILSTDACLRDTEHRRLLTRYRAQTPAYEIPSADACLRNTEHRRLLTRYRAQTPAYEIPSTDACLRDTKTFLVFPVYTIIEI
ncbi:hypothetical protein J6590_010489 [Homalodisca vitripennis]|nr:hypothetical protein J6590_010489 [Homalodisca vitripennis]